MSRCENCIHNELCKYQENGITIAQCVYYIDKTTLFEVVRCKDCKYYDVSRLLCRRPHCNGTMGMYDFCSQGKKEEGGE